MKNIINSWNSFLDMFERNILADHGFVILGAAVAVLAALFILLCYRARNNMKIGKLLHVLFVVWAIILVFVGIWYIISINSNVLFTGVV